MEEGDDRFRGGLNLHLGFNSYSARYYYFMRSFGPVKESTHVLALSRSFPIPGMKFLWGRLGFAPLLETTKLSYSKQEDQAFDTKEAQTNLGFLLGVFMQVTNSGPLSFQIAWESALYPAGLTGGILLATGRKQLFTLSAGMQL